MVRNHIGEMQVDIGMRKLRNYEIVVLKWGGVVFTHCYHSGYWQVLSGEKDCRQTLESSMNMPG